MAPCTSLVVAPMVAKHYHAGEMRKAQAVTALCAWAGFVFSLAVFVGFFFFGDEILSLFGGRQEGGWLILLVGVQLSFYVQNPAYLRLGLVELKLSSVELEEET